LLRHRCGCCAIAADAAPLLRHRCGCAAPMELYNLCVCCL
jgi:hypothetical protein